MAVKAKNNPFSTKRLEKLKYRPSPIAIDQIVKKLSLNGNIGEIAGPHGSGKTTLMLHLSKRLSANAGKIKHVFVNDTNPMTADGRKQLLEDLKPSQIVLIDGADHLGKITWQRLKRRILKAQAGLIITTHKTGMLETIVECSTTPQLLADIANELLRNPKPVCSNLIKEIYARHNGNIRNCLWQMYDIWAEKGKLN